MIVDTGPLYAAIDVADRNHERCLDLLETHLGPLLVPTMVIAEVAYFIEKRLGPKQEVQFLGDLTVGHYVPHAVAASDWLRMAELVATYQDLGLGATDASVIAAAERLGETEVATLDHRHFTVVRPTHGPLTLLP